MVVINTRVKSGFKLAGRNRSEYLQVFTLIFYFWCKWLTPLVYTYSIGLGIYYAQTN